MLEQEAQRGWHDVLMSIVWVMNYKIFEIDGLGISVGKLLTGVLLLVAGYLVSKRASREVERRVFARMPLDDSMRYTLAQVVFYLLMMICTLFTLRVLNVPITIFTVIGGALAVGIGFGSQNVVNNFISGVLVMAERPMRIGDYVEVDGVTGVVESMGIRSTLVRTTKNVLIRIPNTVFIEKNLTNWTMSGSFSGGVTIGVAYGTGVEKLRALAMRALDGITEILRDPAPALNFLDFGDNALIFELAYSHSATYFSMRKATESRIRYRLYALLNEAGISIPYPTRDVRLSAEAPVPVKIIGSPDRA